MELVLKSSRRLVSLYSFLETLYQSFRLIIGWGVMGHASDMLNPFAFENFLKVFEVNWGLLSDTIWSESPMRANVLMWITWAAKGKPILPSSQDLRPGFWWILSVVCKRLSLSTHGSLSSVSLQQRSYFRRMGLVQFVPLNRVHSI